MPSAIPSEAVRRLLWIAVADEVPRGCSCAPDDPAPYCYAWQALGYGKHWPGAARAARRLTKAACT